ncbi:MAG: type II toxin-antitoxin system Phd/YefM family antitoxin [Armatimonadetes bacterium]|nr:type II toxin-antitoxin system Phd/YefM family antitoxin [Armatimonadota bacterium]
MGRNHKPQDLETALAEAAAGRRARVRRGHKTVAVVPLEDLERLEELDAEEDADLLAASLAAEAEAKANGEEPVPWEDVKRRAGLG